MLSNFLSNVRDYGQKVEKNWNEHPLLPILGMTMLKDASWTGQKPNFGQDLMQGFMAGQNLYNNHLKQLQEQQEAEQKQKQAQSMLGMEREKLDSLKDYRNQMLGFKQAGIDQHQKVVDALNSLFGGNDKNVSRGTSDNVDSSGNTLLNNLTPGQQAALKIAAASGDTSGISRILSAPPTYSPYEQATQKEAAKNEAEIYNTANNSDQVLNLVNQSEKIAQNNPNIFSTAWRALPESDKLRSLGSDDYNNLKNISTQLGQLLKGQYNVSAGQLRNVFEQQQLNKLALDPENQSQESFMQSIKRLKELATHNKGIREAYNSYKKRVRTPTDFYSSEEFENFKKGSSSNKSAPELTEDSINGLLQKYPHLTRQQIIDTYNKKRSAK